MGSEGPVPAVQAAKAGWGTTSLLVALGTACGNGLCALLWCQPQVSGKGLVPLPSNQSVREVAPSCRHKEENSSFIRIGSEVSL